MILGGVGAFFAAILFLKSVADALLVQRRHVIARAVAQRRQEAQTPYAGTPVQAAASRGRREGAWRESDGES